MRCALKYSKPIFGKDYFDEQVELIRDISSSERECLYKVMAVCR